MTSVTNIVDILLVLKIVSSIKLNDKLYITDNELKIDKRVFQWIRRYYFDDDRLKPLIFIEGNLVKLDTQIINLLSNEVITTSCSVIQETESEICQEIISYLQDAKRGLDNLKLTYISDQAFTCRVELLIKTIDTKLNKLRGILVIKTS